VGRPCRIGRILRAIQFLTRQQEHVCHHRRFSFVVKLLCVHYKSAMLKIAEATQLMLGTSVKTVLNRLPSNNRLPFPAPLWK
jgi:hypothetical protein